MESTAPLGPPAKKSTGKKIIIYGLPVVVFLIVFLIIIVLKRSGDKSTATAAATPETPAVSNTEVVIGTMIDERSGFDVEHRPVPQELTPQELMHHLRQEIAIASDPYYEPEQAANLETLMPKVLRYVYWGQLVNTAKATADPAMKSLAKELQTKLLECQMKELPRIRKRYAEIIVQRFLKNNIKVEVRGSRNDEICFISSVFTDVDYVRSFQVEVVGVLRSLRYMETRYFSQPGIETYHCQPGSHSDNEILEHFG